MNITISQLNQNEIKEILSNILKLKIQNKVIKKTKINKQTYQIIINTSNFELSKAITLLQLKINNTYEFKQYIKREVNYFVPLVKLIMKKPSIELINSMRLFIYDNFTKFTRENFIVSFTKYLLDLPEETINNEKNMK